MYYLVLLNISAGELGEDIRKLILKIYAAFLSPDGKVSEMLNIELMSIFPCFKFITNFLNYTKNILKWHIHSF